MGCLSLNLQIGPLPQIPPIFTSPISITVSFPPGGFILPPGEFLCCHYELPGFSLPITIPAPIPPAVFTALNALIAAALIILPTINLPSCSKDATT